MSLYENELTAVTPIIWSNILSLWLKHIDITWDSRRLQKNTRWKMLKEKTTQDW